MQVLLDEITGIVTVTAEVENTGKLPGEEVVQLYGSDLCASMIRPVQELTGFKRISLRPGEREKVQFIFCIDFFAFLDRKMEWVVEKGKFRLMIGSNSRDVRKEQIIIWNRTEKIDYRKRFLYAYAAVL